MRDLAKLRILVTGGSGFLGSHLLEDLRRRGCRQIFAPRSRDFDLRTEEGVIGALREARPDLVIHLAAVVGGIGANRQQPGQFFYDNAIMGIRLIEECRLARVAKTVVIGTICAYPKYTPVPFREDELWTGYPEETNAPYGLAKKMLLVQCQAYRQQYGMNAVYLLPVNLYGPRDNFNPETSHVIPAMIRKIHEAMANGSQRVSFWGDGSATREFLHVRDAARGIVLAAERYDAAEPVNLGSGSEISIRDLATLLCQKMGYHGQIVWDTSKPNGQPRRCLDVRQAKQLFDFQAETSFGEGLQETIDWYCQHGAAAPCAA